LDYLKTRSVKISQSEACGYKKSLLILNPQGSAGRERTGKK